MRDEPRAERFTFDWKHGYVKIRDLGSRVKRYHAILWQSRKMILSTEKFDTATEAADFGHGERKKNREALSEGEDDEANPAK